LYQDKAPAPNIRIGNMAGKRLAIGRTVFYWALVPAGGNQLSSIFFTEIFYLYRALVAGQTKS
jgi:hypothetical protein